ncbi:MAG: hypothetical protein OCD01_17660 [Fibrobacterales bacterium]
MEHIIDTPQVISTTQSANQITQQLIFPKNYRYFDGHFPSFKLLPAVAQIDYTMEVIALFLDQPFSLVRIPRIKFKKPILPDVTVDLTIVANNDKSSLSFTFSDSNSKEICSNGKIKLEFK